MIRFYLVLCLTIIINSLTAQNKAAVQLVPVDTGWAKNSVNAVVFRKNSLVTFRDTQFIAYYNNNRFVVLGKRRSGTAKWLLQQTPYQGNAADAHNTICIMVDGDGYLHIAWDHHNNPLNYCKSIYPGSLELTGRLPMTGSNEQKVTYPEFYKIRGGNILFFYRNGASGNGNLVINEYAVNTKKWITVQSSLVDGEGKRNAYWQACTDVSGTIHVSWVWRESPDVASNHDVCYARSRDGGKTWEKSTGEQYTLPINAASAEYICKIPQKSELINQTSMVADEAGNPFIATYYKEADGTIPQYHVIYKTGREWNVQNLGFRTSPFSLSGVGTKRIPISRPQIITWKTEKRLSTAVIFRDAERGDKVSVATCNNIKKKKWSVADLTPDGLGSWEPSYDTELWKEKGILNVFIQNVVQADGEGNSGTAPQLVQVLEWDPKNKK
ncbi:MAG: BNR-4 repeat-containing protein [Ferruginibacter sp.]|nr:BNR-4 repeat-containing protein [Ferruginibacter sp.]